MTTDATLPPSSTAAPLTFPEFWATHYAARYAEEEARERSWQEEAFAEATHTVCGLELRGMTPYDLLLLHGSGNPFAVGGPITAEAIAQFCALLAEPAPRGWFGRRRFFRQLAGYPYAKAVDEVRAYLRRMFASADIAIAPPTNHSPAADAGAAQPELSACFLAPLVVAIACETGWAERDILGMRLDKLFQYRRALASRQGLGTAYPQASKLLSEALVAHAQHLAARAA
jgi:hypothetical protein